MLKAIDEAGVPVDGRGKPESSWFMSKANSSRMVPIRGRSLVVAFGLGFIGTLDSGGSPPAFSCTSCLKYLVDFGPAWEPPVNENTEKPLEDTLVEATRGALGASGVHRALLEAQIEILTQEAISTSAIEGQSINYQTARRSVIRALGLKAGLLSADPPS